MDSVHVAWIHTRRLRSWVLAYDRRASRSNERPLTKRNLELEEVHVDRQRAGNPRGRRSSKERGGDTTTIADRHWKAGMDPHRAAGIHVGSVVAIEFSVELI